MNFRRINPSVTGFSLLSSSFSVDGFDPTDDESTEWILPHASPLQLRDANSIKKEPPCSDSASLQDLLFPEEPRSRRETLSDLQVNTLLALTVKRFVQTMATPYECLLCEESFTDSKSFKLHLWEHLGSCKTVEPNPELMQNAVLVDPCKPEHQNLYPPSSSNNNHDTEVTGEASVSDSAACSSSHSNQTIMNIKIPSINNKIPSEDEDEQVKIKTGESSEDEASGEEDIGLSSDSDFFEDDLSEDFESPLTRNDQTLPVDQKDVNSAATNGDLESPPNPTDQILSTKATSKRKLKKQKLPKIKLTFPCLSCTKTFPSKTHLARHEQFHEKPSEYHCNLCDKVCSKPSLLKQHMKFKHSVTISEPAVCSECNKSFQTQRQLQKHKRTHSDLRLKCNYCDKVYKDNCTLSAHCRAAHNEGKAYQCESCFRKFPTPSQLERHYETHNNSKFACDICGRSYNQRGNLSTHMKSHRGEVTLHKCDKCALMYKHNASLKEHIKIAHGPIVEFKCDKCEKTFHSKVTLNRHAKRHDSAPCKACDICGLGVSSAWALKCHIKRKH